MRNTDIRRFVRHWRVWIASGATLMILLSVWIADRFDIVVGDGETGMKYVRIAQLVSGVEDEPLPSDILAVNIGYDRQLTEVCDDYGMPMGRIDITDRNALRVFLDAIKDTPYKSVILDVFFDQSLPAEGDSALFALVNSMDRLVIPVHADGSLSHAIDRKNIASGDYTVTYEQSSFVKYPFIGAGGLPSMALAAYRHELGSQGRRDFGEGLFIQKSPILTLPIVLWGPYDIDNRKTWYNLTADLLECYSPSELARLVEGKHVVVGDFTNVDFHETYVGAIPGALIHINALVALQRGKTTVKLLSALFLCIGCFVICRFMASGWTLWDYFHWKPGRFMGFLLSFVGFSTALMAMQIIGFIVFGEFHDFWPATILLSAYAVLCQYLNKKYPLCRSTTVSDA